MYASQSPQDNEPIFKIQSSVLNWEFELRNLMRIHESIPLRDVSIWQHRIVKALSRLPYCKGTNILKSESQEIMAEVRCNLKDISSNAEGVLKDYMNILKAHIVGDKNTSFVFDATEDGFDLYFSAWDENEGLFAAVIRSQYTKAV